VGFDLKSLHSYPIKKLRFSMLRYASRNKILKEKQKKESSLLRERGYAVKVFGKNTTA
tara:strand:+ start:3057 stop:3230 length:174 start_codon:yes stop_codon:yes gene_type:complete